MDKIDFLKNFADQFDETDADELTMETVEHLFDRHPDIENEFATWIQNGRIPEKPVAVHVCGKEYTAYTLMREFQGIKSYYDAYSMLAFLKDDPEYAASLLKRGLPIK